MSLNGLITANAIAKRVVVLTGPSGGGKSEIVKQLQEVCTMSGGRVECVGSGDLFGAAALTDKGLAAQMSRGEYIPDLVPIIGQLEERVERFLWDLIARKDVILVLNGVDRLGEYYYEGKLIASQARQIAGAFGRALQRIAKDGGVGLDPELSWYVRDAEFPNDGKGAASERMQQELMNRATQIFVQVTEGDADTLMRLRSVKSLQALEGRISGVEDLRLLGWMLEEIRLLQEGKVVLDGDRLTTNINAEGYVLKVMPIEVREAIDRRMIELVTPDFLAGVREECTGAGVDLNGISLPRMDDLFWKARKKRIEEFTRTREGVLIKEQGYTLGKGGVLVGDGKMGLKLTLLNGPEYGVDYTLLGRLTSEIAVLVFKQSKGGIEKNHVPGVEGKTKIFVTKEG